MINTRSIVKIKEERYSKDSIISSSNIIRNNEYSKVYYLLNKQLPHNVNQKRSLKEIAVYFISLITNLVTKYLGLEEMLSDYFLVPF